MVGSLCAGLSRLRAVDVDLCLQVEEKRINITNVAKELDGRVIKKMNVVIDARVNLIYERVYKAEQA